MSALTYQAAVPVADILESPVSAPTIGKGESQLLFGEAFCGDREANGWVHGRSEIDGYEGWVRRDCLAEKRAEETHFVAALSALVYPEPDFKARPVLNLSFLSRLIAVDPVEQNGFLWCAGTGWIPLTHIAPVSRLSDDPVEPIETALTFIHAPYRYGGRLAWGLDCSGLVQLSLLRAGFPTCPRDSSDQRALGTEVAHDDVARGDLIFFPGHVGIMVDRDNTLNASARTMSVAVEPLNTLKVLYSEVTAIRRVRP